MQKLSIVIPMYNSFKLLKNNLMRLNNIKLFELDVIVVDDCSKDSSYEQAVNFAKQMDYSIKIIKNEKNSGPGISRNVGIENATGEYITFIDSDDYVSEDFEKHVVNLMESKIDCIIFDYFVVDSKGIKIHSGKSIDIPMEEGFIKREDAFVYTFGSTCGKIYRKEIIDKYHVKFANLFRNEDMPFTKKAIAMSESIYYIEKELYMYVQVESSLMHSNFLNDEKNCQLAFSLLKESLKGYGFEEELKAIELREVLNNSVLIMVGRKAPRKEIIEYIKKSYKPEYWNNNYFNRYSKKTKIITRLAQMHMVTLLRAVWEYKKWKEI